MTNGETMLRALSSRPALLMVAAGSAASAQSPADFYRGKTIELYVDVSVGGGYDLYARMLARHIGKHIPGNPTDRAAEHAGRRRHAARQLALQRRGRRTAPCSAPSARAMAFEPLLGNKAAQYDGTKFN